VKALVLGLGNSLRRDDAVGLKVAGALAKTLADNAEIEVAEDTCGGLRLMERMVGYDRAVIIDAAELGKPPGVVSVLSPEDLPTHNGACAHDADLLTALRLGRKLGAELPSDRNIRLVAIQAADEEGFGLCCSSDVERAIPEAHDTALAVLEELRWRS
jgi:hydrogenase maturation protease